MKIRAFLVLVSVVFSTPSCAGTPDMTTTERELVNFLTPLVFGDKNYQADLMPNNSVSWRINYPDVDAEKRAWAGGNGLEYSFAYRYFRPFLISGDYWNTIEAREPIGLIPFYATGESRVSSADEIWQNLDRVDSFIQLATDDLSASTGGDILGFRSSAKYLAEVERYSNSKLSSGEKFTVEPLSDSCAYVSKIYPQSYRRESLLLLHVPDGIINMDDLEDYACLMGFVVRHLDFRGLFDRKEMLRRFPSAKQLGIRQSANCKIALEYSDQPQDRKQEAAMASKCMPYRGNLLPMVVYHFAFKGLPWDARSMDRDQFSQLVIDTYRRMPPHVKDAVKVIEKHGYKYKYAPPRKSGNIRARSLSEIGFEDRK